MTQFCIQGASTLKKSNEKTMATSSPESSVYQSKSFAKLQSAMRKPFHYDSKHLFLQAYLGWFFVLHIFAIFFLLDMISARSILIIFQFLNKGNIGEAIRLRMDHSRIFLFCSCISFFFFSVWPSLFFRKILNSLII